VGAGIGERTDLALEATHPEATGDADPVDVLEVAGRTGGRRALVGGDPADLDLGLVCEATGLERLGHREVGVVEIDVLAHAGRS